MGNFYDPGGLEQFQFHKFTFLGYKNRPILYPIMIFNIVLSILGGCPELSDSFWRDMMSIEKRSYSKPKGWWTTHPTLLNVSVHGLCDSNSDGLGDFEGVRQKLDFFLDMGVSGFRFQHVGDYGDDPAWSGLVQQNWFDVDPHYGTMDDFDRLMADCARRDIRIMMMAVPEYIGWHHPDYLAACKAREKGFEDPRVRWFDWRDDGSVVTCWDRPAPDCSNPEYMNAFLKHIDFWMDKGIAGWDADAVPVWHNLTVEMLRKFTGAITGRNGLVTAENFLLQTETLRKGGFNAGPGRLRTELYNELKAIREHDANYIRAGLRVREELIANGLFPYQQFGDETYNTLYHNAGAHNLDMFKLQVAFNAILPDQVWIAERALTLTENPITSPQKGSSVDWLAIHEQEQFFDSPFSHMKRMFLLRARHKELAIGHIEEVRTDHPETVFAAIRTSEDEQKQALVIFNFLERPDHVIVFIPNGIRQLRNYLTGEFVQVGSGQVQMRMPLLGYRFFEVQ